MTNPHLARSADELKKFAATFAKKFSPGDVLALEGDLGAGKTTFTQGLLLGLGYSGTVTSPTFSLVQEYPAARFPVYHFDFYRLESEAEIDALGWDDILERGGLVVVEWAGLYPNLLPPHSQWLEISLHPEGRLIQMKS